MQRLARLVPPRELSSEVSVSVSSVRKKMALLRLCSGPNYVKFTGKAAAAAAASAAAAAARNQVSLSWLAGAAGPSAVVVNNYSRRHYQRAGAGVGADKREDELQQALGQVRGVASAASAAPRDPLNTGFADPVAAFKSKTLLELVRAYAVYMICSSSYIVENNMQVRHPYLIAAPRAHFGGQQSAALCG